MGNMFSSMFAIREPAHGHSNQHTKEMIRATTKLLEHHADSQAHRNRRRKERGSADAEDLKRYRKMHKIYEETGDPADLVRWMERMGVRRTLRAEAFLQGQWIPCA